MAHIEITSENDRLLVVQALEVRAEGGIPSGENIAEKVRTVRLNLVYVTIKKMYHSLRR